MKVLHTALLVVHLAAAVAVPARVAVAGRFISQASKRGGNETDGAAEGEAGEEEGDEIEEAGEFGVAVALQGGDVKQDTLFPPGENGVFEIEFSNAQGRTLTVTENKAPAAPPSGFTALEPVSYKVELAEGADNITLSKVDWILNEGNSLDISQGQIGRFCAEAGTFVIDDAVGELEFEADENELTLSVANINGEWGIFLPDAAGAGEEVDGDAAAGGEAGTSTGSRLVDAIIGLLQGGRA